MSGETHSVKRHLRVDAEGYDVQIRRLIPHYDEMIATGVEVLAALAPAHAHVLDLGGGTGALSSAILDGLPGARVTVLDVDAEMLAEARRRLAGFGDRVSFQQASFLDPLRWRTPIVTSLALHHVHDLATKTALYRAIYDALSPRGVLLNLDAAVTEGARLSSLVFDQMAARMGDHGISKAQAHQHFASWAREDRYFPVDAELGALRKAGFDEVECFWRRGLKRRHMRLARQLTRVSRGVVIPAQALALGQVLACPSQHLHRAQARAPDISARSERPAAWQRPRACRLAR